MKLRQRRAKAAPTRQPLPRARRRPLPRGSIRRWPPRTGRAAAPRSRPLRAAPLRARAMGSGLSTASRAAVKLADDRRHRTDSHRNRFKLEAAILSKSEVDGILEDDSHKCGTYILYEDLEKEKMYLAFKTLDKKIAHYAIVKMNDLYYFNDFPFPYLESIVLYYKRHKFKDTKLTGEAFLEPYLRTQQNKRKSARSLTTSLNNVNEAKSADNDKTWTYGHYKSLSTRL